VRRRVGVRQLEAHGHAAAPQRRFNLLVALHLWVPTFVFAASALCVERGVEWRRAWGCRRLSVQRTRAGANIVRLDDEVSVNGDASCAREDCHNAGGSRTHVRRACTEVAIGLRCRALPVWTIAN
jgi:hypothetical protein